MNYVSHKFLVLFTHIEVNLCVDLMVGTRRAVLVIILQDICIVVICQDTHEAATIPVVRNTATVVHLARGVHQHFVGDFLAWKKLGADYTMPKMVDFLSMV